MKKLILSGLIACGRNEPGPVVPPPEPVLDPDPDPEPVDPTDRTDPPCEPAGVDVLELTTEPIAGQPFGRTVAVHLESEAGVAVSCTLDAAPPIWQQLVPLQSTWKYRGDGVDPGAGWTDAAFDDSAWPAGRAPFGAGDPVVTALVPEGQDAPASAWFRTSFTVDDPAAVLQLRMAARRDDGIVAYLNGVEVARDNVPVVALVAGGDERELFRYTIDLSQGVLVAGENTLAVELQQSDGSADAGFDLRLVALVAAGVEPEVHLVEDPVQAIDHTFTLYGLLADATYTCTARTDSTCEGASASATVVTEPFGSTLPPLAQHPEHPTPSWGAYTLFNHQRPCVLDYQNRLVIVDPEGRPRWAYDTALNAPSSIDIESAFLAPDAVLWGGGQRSEGIPQIVGLDGVVRHVANYPGATDDTYHHDVEQLPDGRILGIANGRVTGLNQSGLEDDWSGFSLIEHDPATGEETWRWRAQQAFDLGQLPAPLPDESDPYHANSLVALDDADGQGVYVTLLSTNEVIRVDRATGEIVAHIGPDGDYQLVDPTGAPLPVEEWFDHVHGANLYGDKLYMYDNGWAWDRSRAIAMRIDSTNQTAELAWSWTEFGWYEPNWGDVDELPNGAVLITMAHRYCGGGNHDHPGALVEVDPATQDVVWRLDFIDSDDSTYRGERIDGCELFANSRYCPEIAERVEALGL